MVRWNRWIIQIKFDYMNIDLILSLTSVMPLNVLKRCKRNSIKITDNVQMGIMIYSSVFHHLSESRGGVLKNRRWYVVLKYTLMLEIRRFQWLMLMKFQVLSDNSSISSYHWLCPDTFFILISWANKQLNLFHFLMNKTTKLVF